MKSAGWWDGATELFHCQQPPAGAPVVRVGSLVWYALLERVEAGEDAPPMDGPRYISARVADLGRVYVRRLDPLGDW